MHLPVDAKSLQEIIDELITAQHKLIVISNLSNAISAQENAMAKRLSLHEYALTQCLNKYINLLNQLNENNTPASLANDNLNESQQRMLMFGLQLIRQTTHIQKQVIQPMIAEIEALSRQGNTAAARTLAYLHHPKIHYRDDIPQQYGRNLTLLRYAKARLATDLDKAVDYLHLAKSTQPFLHCDYLALIDERAESSAVSTVSISTH